MNEFTLTADQRRAIVDETPQNDGLRNLEVSTHDFNRSGLEEGNAETYQQENQANESQNLYE